MIVCKILGRVNPAGAAPISAATRRSILLLSFATFSSMAAQRICDAMLPELAREFAASLAQAARVVSVFAVVYGAAQLFYGPLGDRLGKFRIVAYATLGCCVGSSAAVFAASLDMLVLARVLMALSGAAIIPMAMAWTGDVAPADQVQETLARVGLGSTFGLVGGQLLGGLFTDTLGWRWAFGFMALLFGVVGCLLLADWRRQRAALAPPTDSASRPAARPGFVAQVRVILTGTWSRIVLLAGFAEGAAAFGVLAIWASHLHGAMGLPLALAGAIVALFGMGGVFYMMVARHMIRRLGQARLVLFGTCLMGLATLVLGYVPYRLASIAASLVAGFGFFMFHNTMQASAAQMVPAARGMAVSFFASVLFLGQSVGVLIAASLVERIGSGSVIALGGGAMVALGVFFARALQRRQYRENA